MVDRFSENDEEKKAKLFGLGVPEWMADCVRQCQEAIRVQCIDKIVSEYYIDFQPYH